jgi:DNA repair protein RadA/Sms
MCVAIVSSLRDRAVPSDMAIFGEVGLTGELRAVARPAQRLQEAKQLGFTRVLLPAANLTHIAAEDREGVTLCPAADLEAALAIAFE